LSGLLFGVGSLDATTFLASAALLGGTCLAAGAVPAFRATGVDGLEALKG